MPDAQPIDAFQRMIDVLSAQKRVLLTTHVKPDGDALGTTAAMAMGLAAKGVTAEVLLLSRLPRKYSFLYRDNGVVHHVADESWPAGLDLDSFDALLVADTGTWSQLPGLRERIERWPRPKLVLDHHLTQQDWPDVKLVLTDAAAAGEIAAELLERWGVAFTPAIAAALFVAITSDTGWFQFANTRPRTLRLAAKLVEAGADSGGIYQLLYQNERAERVMLQTRAQQSLELLANNRLAVMRLGRRDFAETRGAVTDTENVINIPLQIATVETSILLTDRKSVV